MFERQLANEIENNQINLAAQTLRSDVLQMAPYTDQSGFHSVHDQAEQLIQAVNQITSNDGYQFRQAFDSIEDTGRINQLGFPIVSFVDTQYNQIDASVDLPIQEAPPPPVYYAPQEAPPPPVYYAPQEAAPPPVYYRQPDSGYYRQPYPGPTPAVPYRSVPYGAENGDQSALSCAGSTIGLAAIGSVIGRIVTPNSATGPIIGGLAGAAAGSTQCP